MRRFRIERSLIGTMFVLALSSGVVLATEPAGGEVSSPASDWLIETIDATREVGYNVSVATDPVTGDMYISYYEGNDGDLWLARTGAPSGNCGPGNTWECQVVDSIGIVGKFSSIAVGGTGPVASLYISYHDVNNGGLKVLEGSVTRTTGDLTYSKAVIDLGDPAGGTFVGSRTAITLAGDGTPHIGYQVDYGAAQAIRHAVKVAMGAGNCGTGTGNWQCTTIHLDFDIGDFIDIDVNLGGNPSMAFHTSYSTNSFPIVASWVGSGGSCNSSDSWNCTEVRNGGANTGEYLAYALGDNSLPHLAYRNENTDSLEWATWVGSPNGNCGPYHDSWQCEWIDDIGPGTSPAGIDMTTDSNGDPIIVYQDLESGYEDLKIARPQPPFVGGNCGPWSSGLLDYTWLCETLEEGNLSHREAYGGLSIAVNANDEAAVAYRELWGTPPTDGRLKVAREFIPIFVDGFESGDMTRWSVTVP